MAGELATQRPAMGLLLESCFPSIEAVARHHYMGLPLHWLLGASFRLEDRLPHLSLPKLFVHGDRDDIIPIELGQRAFAAAKAPKEFYICLLYTSSRAYEERHRVGGGASVGFYADLAERWRLLASTSYLRYALGERTDDVRWSVGQRYTLAQNWALRLEYSHRDHDNDVLFTVQAFF